MASIKQRHNSPKCRAQLLFKHPIRVFSLTTGVTKTKGGIAPAAADSLEQITDLYSEIYSPVSYPDLQMATSQKLRKWGGGSPNS